MCRCSALAGATLRRASAGRSVAGGRWLEPPGAPANFAVSATPGSLDLTATWGAVEGATSYKLRWRQAGGEFEEANTITVTDASATITVSGYGQWEVQLQACNDAGCGPEASGTVELSPLQPPASFAVSVTLGSLDVRAEWDEVEGATAYRLRWRQAGGEFEAANVIAVADASATITMSGYGEWEVQLQACNDAGCVPEDDVPSAQLSLVAAREDQGEGQGQSRSRALSSTGTLDPVGEAASYTVGWRRDGADAQTPALSQPDGARQPRGAGGPTSQGNTASPRLERGEIDGDRMTFHFSEALDEAAVGARFRVTLDWGTGWCEFTAYPWRVEVSGSRVVVHGLSHGGWPGWERAQAGHRVTAFYYKDDRAVPASRRLRDLDGNEVSTPHRRLGGSYPATRTIELSNLTPAPKAPEPPAPGRVPALGRATAHPQWLIADFRRGIWPGTRYRRGARSRSR